MYPSVSLPVSTRSSLIGLLGYNDKIYQNRKHWKPRQCTDKSEGNRITCVCQQEEKVQSIMVDLFTERTLDLILFPSLWHGKPTMNNYLDVCNNEKDETVWWNQRIIR